MLGALSSVKTNDVSYQVEMPEQLSGHYNAAVSWLKRAHDSTTDDGVGYGYYMRGLPFQLYGFGWRPSYVETSGYIIETFYDAEKVSDNLDCAARAERIAYWLLTQQQADGSFANESFANSEGLIFDTGQVLFGLLRAHMETGDEAFKLSARKAVYFTT